MMIEASLRIIQTVRDILGGFLLGGDLKKQMKMSKNYLQHPRSANRSSTIRTIHVEP